MKKLICLALLLPVLLSCDPVSQMEANIENQTTQSLSIVFVSSDTNFQSTLELAPNQVGLFQEGFDIGSTYLEPSLVEYDSVMVKNQVGEILKVYKSNNTGKNIYKVKEYWLSSEPSKRFFKYKYEIRQEDID